MIWLLFRDDVFQEDFEPCVFGWGGFAKGGFIFDPELQSAVVLAEFGFARLGAAGLLQLDQGALRELGHMTIQDRDRGGHLQFPRDAVMRARDGPLAIDGPITGSGTRRRGVEVTGETDVLVAARDDNGNQEEQGEREMGNGEGWFHGVKARLLFGQSD